MTPAKPRTPTTIPIINAVLVLPPSLLDEVVVFPGGVGVPLGGVPGVTITGGGAGVMYLSMMPYV
jgi:hypothetical protein